MSYSVEQLSIKDIKTLLSAQLAGGGVFGLEGHHSSYEDSLNFFAPSFYKVEWKKSRRDDVFTQLSNRSKDITLIQIYTQKSSLFPVSMQATLSFWEKVRNICPEHIGVFYQLLLVYRQDNWQVRLKEQYEDYLNGIQRPSEKSFIRKIQRNMNSSLDQFLKWEYKNLPIKEVENKMQENGFRYNMRLAFYGGTKKERKELAHQIKEILQSMSYLNDWSMNTHFVFDDIIQNIKNRKLDNLGKQNVLTVSELLPFMIYNSKNTIQSQQDLVQINNKNKQILHTKNESSFELLPLGQKLKPIDGTKIAQKFIYALKEVGKITNEITIKRIDSGATMMKIVFDLPKGVKLSQINKKNVIEDIQTFMGMKNIRITQGDGVGEFDVWIPQEQKQKILLRNYIDTPSFRKFVEDNALPFLVGLDAIGNPIYKDLNKVPHILVAGTTGSGKSVWVNQLILTLLLVRKPEELQFYMIDIKQVELPIYKKFPHVHSVITDADEAVHLLKKITIEMNNRYMQFKEAEVKNIALFNKKRPVKKLPYLVVVIDEYAELALRTKEVHDLIQSIAQLSRAAGIHLIIATQNPKVDVIPSVIKSNLSGKIGFRCSNGNSYMTFLNTRPPFNLLGNGDGTMSFEGQSEEHIRFQGCLIVDDPNNNDLETRLINDIAESMDEYKLEELPEGAEKEELTELDKLKRIIATTNETRVSQLRDTMKININRLHDLMKELVEEGWLEKPTTKQSGYQLIVREDEKAKWRD